MTKYITIFLAFLTFSILISCNQKTSEKKVTDKPIPESVDYHKIIDLVIENHLTDGINKYDFDIKYAGTTDSKNLNDMSWSKKYIDLKTQIELLKELKSSPDSFEFNKAKLSSKTKELLTHEETTNGEKMTYVFNSFWSNKVKDSVIVNFLVLVKRKDDSEIVRGREEIGFFSKKNNKWTTDNQIEFVEF